MGICPFHLRDVAKCLYFETIQQNTPVLKLDLMKIKLFGKIHMEHEFHNFFFFFFFFFLSLIAYNSIFRKSSFKTGVFYQIVSEQGHFAPSFEQNGQNPFFAKLVVRFTRESLYIPNFSLFAQDDHLPSMIRMQPFPLPLLF